MSPDQALEFRSESGKVWMNVDHGQGKGAKCARLTGQVMDAGSIVHESISPWFSRQSSLPALVSQYRNRLEDLGPCGCNRHPIGNIAQYGDLCRGIAYKVIPRG
jgi:hypothetical protein